jgi:hypothetical protein
MGLLTSFFSLLPGSSLEPATIHQIVVENDTILGDLASLRQREGEATWVPEVGDRFLVDVDRNIGRLLHKNGTFYSFPVITGQRRTVSYIGLRYFAATPKHQWEVTSLDQQRDRITYGREGHFLRLSLNGERTHYGIHAHRDERRMFAEEDRYQSMGCIIVRESDLDLLIETFRKKGERMEVLTY